jgi:glutamate-ammonia-ligase adenylyltransferase
MKREVLREKGGEVSIQDIRAMRARIERELSKEAMGHDIKLGPGGLEELEFTVQYLQLINMRNHGALMVQGTLEGITRLSAAGVIGKETASRMKETYIFYRTLEGFLRLIQEPVLREQSISAVVAAELMGFPDSSGLLKELREKREGVRHWFENLR